MKMDLARTIVALSSGLAPARRAIVRISGAKTKAILDQLISAQDESESIAKHHFLSTAKPERLLASCRCGMGERLLPVDVYWWPDSRSFTGECCAELHLLGSLPIVESLMESVVQLGAEPAERGEFTLRSFLAGKIDLTQAEAVLGVIQADDESQLARALGQLAGNLSKPVRALRDQLVELTAHLEAGLDFVEEDIEFISCATLTRSLVQIKDRLDAISKQLESRGSRSRKIEVVLVGLPNAGKSSLFNAIAGAPRAIVSNVAGTTRDAVTEDIHLGDLSIHLVDTAGMEELQDSSPRALAQQVLQTCLSTADLIVLCVDMSTPLDESWIQMQCNVLSNFAAVLRVGTKADLYQALDANAGGLPCVDLMVSTQQADSIQQLRSRLATAISDSRSDLQVSAMHHTMIRCRQSIDAASQALTRALENVGVGEELVASELRIALDDMASVIGEVHSDDILGEIFSRFCIGK